MANNDNDDKRLIKDKVFDTRGPVPGTVWQKLFCNSETNVTSVLARGGWDRSSPVMTPVINYREGRLRQSAGLPLRRPRQPGGRHLQRQHGVAAASAP